MLWIITGKIRSGKTTLLQQIVNRIGSNKVTGIVSPSEDKEGDVVGYDAVILPQGKRVRIVSRRGTGEKVGRFVMLDKGKKEVARILSRARKTPELFVFDEFGPLELKGKGLRSVFDKFLKKGEMGVVVVRKSLLPDFINVIWGRKPYKVFEVGSGSEKEIINEVVKALERRYQQ